VVHRVARGRAAQVGEAGAADQAARRVGVRERRQQPARFQQRAVRLARLQLRRDQRFEREALADRRQRQLVGRLGPGHPAHLFAVGRDHPDARPAVRCAVLDQSHLVSVLGAICKPRASLVDGS